MPGCVFHVTGKTLQPEEILAGTTLNPYRMFRRGDPIAHGPHKDAPHDVGGFSLDVSDADGNLDEQVRHAMDFLRNHYDELLPMLQNDMVTDARLDFGYDCRIGNGVAVQCDYLPPELIRLCADLNIGIELSLYPSLER